MLNKILTTLSILSCLLYAPSHATQADEISVIAFDFGGVVAKADTAQMASYLMETFHLNREELLKALSSLEAFTSRGGSEIKYWEQLALSKEIELADDWELQWADVIHRSITEIPGTIAIVQELQRQGYQTAMLSDVTHYQAEIIRKMGFYDLFDPVILSYQTGVTKPNPRAFEILLETLQKPASQLLFIDDRLENTAAAKAQGIDAIPFINPEALNEELSSRGFKTLSLIP